MRNSPPSRGSVSARVSLTTRGRIQVPRLSASSQASNSVLGRGGDLAPHGHGELARGAHFDSFPASRLVTKRSSEASWSLQKRR